MANSEILTLYPSKIKHFLYLIGSLAFIVIGVILILNGQSVGWFPFTFFGICIIVFIINLIPGSSYLHLSKDGFKIRTLFRDQVIKWSDVKSFRSGYIGPNKSVVFHFSSEHKEHQEAKKWAKSLAGVEGALPDTYGKSPKELADILNEWKGKYSN